MIVTVSHMESGYNRAKRERTSVEFVDGRVSVPVDVALAMRRLAVEYRYTVADLVGLALSYYFGDGADHLMCEHCGFWRRGDCIVPEKGEQATLPLLDKGSVDVGLPTVEQG